jgi:hypothetical protein
MIRDSERPPFEFRTTAAPLLGQCVALLAMKHGRAPLLFLGDARMLVAELRIRPQISIADSGAAEHPGPDCRNVQEQIE